MDSLAQDLGKVNLLEGDDVDAAVLQAPEGEEQHELTLKERVREEVSLRMRERDLLVPFRNHKPDGQLKIPYFKGDRRAAERFAGSPEFRGARAVKVNPSLAQMHLRKLVMKAKKDLVVPVPSLEDEGGDAAFAHLVRGDRGPELVQKACTKAGVARRGTKLSLTSWPEDLKVDLFVVGSVAVTKQGFRLGKGRGYAELEWGVMWSLGAVDAGTTVATTVHEAQLVSQNKLPLAEMERHDLPVDVIVTPRRIIRVKERLPKPDCGVLWEKLSEEDLNAMPVLKELKKKEQKSS